MNGMSGLDCRQRLAVPVTFITARDDTLSVERIERRKPIDAEAVLAAIRQAADGRGQGPIGSAVRR